MMNGEIWWVDFQEPRGSAPAFLRPAIVVQNNELNESSLNTTVVIPITTNCRLAEYRGNIFLEHEDSRWLTKETLRSVEWLPADQLILDKIEELL